MYPHEPVPKVWVSTLSLLSHKWVDLVRMISKKEGIVIVEWWLYSWCRFELDPFGDRQLSSMVLLWLFPFLVHGLFPELPLFVPSYSQGFPYLFLIRSPHHLPIPLPYFFTFTCWRGSPFTFISDFWLTHAYFSPPIIPYQLWQALPRPSLYLTIAKYDD